MIEMKSARGIYIFLFLFILAGCASAVRQGRPWGANFSKDDYYRIASPDAGAPVEEPAPVDLVNPLMGTDSTFAYSHGNTYPAVALPWGMNFWTPQTGMNVSGWQYTYRGRMIRGFKETHQPSPWANDYGCFSLMPVTGTPGLDEAGRASAFRHATEVAKPYYYKVHLDRYNVDAEITPTERAAVMRFTFPPTERAYIALDVFGTGEVEFFPAEGKIIGYTAYKTGGAPANFRNRFVIKFEPAFTRSGKKLGVSRGYCVRFDAEHGASVTARIGSSFISAEQAELNLEREVGVKSFDQVRDEARAAWDRGLSRIMVAGGTMEQRVTFYSALYRMMLFPRRFYEVNAQGETAHYSPFDGKVHPGYMFTDTGFWDTFRALFPFFTLMYPELDGEIMQGLLNAYREGGRLPSWSSPGYYDSMIGAHPASVLADAWIKGIRGFDDALAWEAMVKDAEVPEKRMRSMGRYGLENYNRLGCIPCDVGVDQSVSRSLEYAYDDFCLGRFALASGREKEAGKYLARALNYKNLFDPSTGFMRGRKQDGTWRDPFDPFAWGGDFTEGSAWHYTWSVFQDPQGLIELMGGQGRFTKKLDSVFTAPSTAGFQNYGYKIHEITEMQAAGMGQYAHGNQPIQHAIYLYCCAGQPWKAQARAREVMARLYNPYPKGYCGDEDNGQTSAWYVFSALGFYPVCPGVPQYVLGSPLFERAALSLPNGKTFVIEARAQSPKNVYIRRASLNGKELRRNYITHREILEGGGMVLEMEAKPALDRGTSIDDAPYSLSRDPELGSLMGAGL